MFAGMCVHTCVSVCSCERQRHRGREMERGEDVPVSVEAVLSEARSGDGV